MGRKNRRMVERIKPLPVRELMTNQQKTYISNINPKRMEVWYADLGIKADSCVQGGKRPVLIISNDRNNELAQTVTVIPMTSKMKRPGMPTHAWIKHEFVEGARRGSMVLAEQITTVDKSCLDHKMFECKDPEVIKRIERAVRVQVFGN